MPTKIEWTHRPGTIGETWNLIGGCTKVSPGCTNCYALRDSWRIMHNPNHPARYDGVCEKVNGVLRWTGKINIDKAQLEKPLRWRKPRTVFVCSMSDFFHPAIPLTFQNEVFNVIRQCPQHTFMILTKRAEQMAMMEYACGIPELPNLWLGVTAENQRTADERIPLLLQTPAAVRFVSCEPLLEEIDLRHYLHGMPEPYGGGVHYVTHEMALDAGEPEMEGTRIEEEPEWEQTAPPLDAVFCGAETGPGKRKMNQADAISLQKQCERADVPFLFKRNNDGSRLLDGREYNEWPEAQCPPLD